MNHQEVKANIHPMGKIEFLNTLQYTFITSCELDDMYADYLIAFYGYRK